MAKISVELELDDESLEDIVGALRSLETISKATHELTNDLEFLIKTIATNQREMKKLTTSVAALLKESKNGSNARVKSKEEGS